eukprot:COSAG06_NODE_14222_length_1176_cov_2.294063_1_plen_37_part_01
MLAWGDCGLGTIPLLLSFSRYLLATSGGLSLRRLTGD